MGSIAENITEIKSKIANAKLVAVSKTHGIEKVREALACGQRIFGENRVQEAESKFPELRKEYNDIELHLIGPLQTNKVKEALELFDVIQTLDREKLAKEIAKQLQNHTTTQLKLSMGMSGDYMEAVEMGADYVRIGSAIFGERNYN